MLLLAANHRVESVLDGPLFLQLLKELGALLDLLLFFVLSPLLLLQIGNQVLHIVVVVDAEVVQVEIAREVIPFETALPVDL